MRPKPNAQPNQSLIDGIATLQALATSPEPVGNRELARRLGFEPTRVNRLLRTLAYLGIAAQTADRKYTAGPGMHVLSAQSLYASGLIRRALPALESLRRLGHTVALGVLWRDNVSYLFHAPPGTDAAHGLGRIGLYPATCGGIGMALLSRLEPQDLQDLFGEEPIPRYPGGVDELHAALAVVRQQGFARVAVGENNERHTIALTLGEPPHSAIGVSGWIPEEATAAVVAALEGARDAITRPTGDLADPSVFKLAV